VAVERLAMAAFASAQAPARPFSAAAVRQAVSAPVRPRDAAVRLRPAEGAVAGLRRRAARAARRQPVAAAQLRAAA